MVFMLTVSSSSPLEFVWNNFYIFANRLLQLCILSTGPVSLHLGVSAIAQSLCFSTLHYCFRLVNISFYIEQQPILAII